MCIFASRVHIVISVWFEAGGAKVYQRHSACDTLLCAFSPSLGLYILSWLIIWFLSLLFCSVFSLRLSDQFKNLRGSELPTSLGLPCRSCWMEVKKACGLYRWRSTNVCPSADVDIQCALSLSMICWRAACSLVAWRSFLPCLSSRSCNVCRLSNEYVWSGLLVHQCFVLVQTLKWRQIPVQVGENLTDANIARHWHVIVMVDS